MYVYDACLFYVCSACGKVCCVTAVVFYRKKLLNEKWRGVGRHLVGVGMYSRVCVGMWVALYTSGWVWVVRVCMGLGCECVEVMRARVCECAWDCV